MLVLLSSDLHGTIRFYRSLISLIEARSPSALVLAGDLTAMSSSPSLESERLIQLLDSVSVPIYFIMGNDDELDWDGLPHKMHAINQRKIPFGTWSIVGYQYTPPFVGGPFEKTEPEIEADLQKLEALMDRNTILVTHGPARGTLDRTTHGDAVGSTALASFIDSVPFYAHIHGHIHESFGRSGKHFNVAAPISRRAVLLDLARLESTECPL